VVPIRGHEAHADLGSAVGRHRITLVALSGGVSVLHNWPYAARRVHTRASPCPINSAERDYCGVVQSRALEQAKHALDSDHDLRCSVGARLERCNHQRTRRQLLVGPTHDTHRSPPGGKRDATTQTIRPATGQTGRLTSRCPAHHQGRGGISATTKTLIPATGGFIPSASQYPATSPPTRISAANAARGCPFSSRTPRVTRYALTDASRDSACANRLTTKRSAAGNPPDASLTGASTASASKIRNSFSAFRIDKRTRRRQHPRVRTMQQRPAVRSRRTRHTPPQVRDLTRLLRRITRQRHQTPPSGAGVGVAGPCHDLASCVRLTA
jgi:hypothetical protein